MVQFHAMRALIKDYLLKLPTPLKRSIVYAREAFWTLKSNHSKGSNYALNKSLFSNKTRILIYGIHGLRHAGTEKNLQLMANSLADEFEVYFMYGAEPESESRKALLNKNIHFVPFTYTKNEIAAPHQILGMNPTLSQVLEEYAIDLLITASPGYAHYPWNQITNIPIILLNIFGAPTLQKNIKAVIYNSATTKKHAENWIGEDKRGHVRYAPLYNLPPTNFRELGQQLRQKLSIPASDFVFGRIGRADDTIFDPIGIKAWQLIADKYPNAHNIIMSPAPALIKIVETENIPRVHLLPASGEEKDVWAFHGAIDSFAHFRYDGETSGVAIAESLYASNPIISHKSHIWNAHLEYLTPEIARIAEKDDVKMYAQYLEEFIQLKQLSPSAWQEMQKRAQVVAKEKFSPNTYSEFTKRLVKETLISSKKHI